MRGLTLPEILITLGIVGVVAALTIPTVKNEYMKKQTVERLKQTYSLMNNAMNRAEVDYGERSMWYKCGTTTCAETYFQTYFAPYLNVVKQYGQGEYFTLSNYSRVPWRTLYYSYTLNNGATISVAFIGHLSLKYFVIIDINGLKAPNQSGVDLFYFYFTEDNELLPQCNTLSREELINGQDWSNDCHVNSDAYGCAALIMLDGWQIAKDYPFGKTSISH